MIGRRSKTPAPEADKPKGFDDFELRLGDLMRGERATLGKSLLDVQRELKIKATYIAAIENADVGAFETPGFIAGYVRSYSRYLGMDPDMAFAKFCREANFEVAHGMSAAASPVSIAAKRAKRADGEGHDPIANPAISFTPVGQSLFSRVEPGAIGSIALLVALIGAIGYGGWSVLQEVQRVQLAPIDQAPSVVAEIDPLGNVAGDAPLVRSAPEQTQQLAAADGATADPLDRLYRPEALDVPLLEARDGPIGTINPRQGAAEDTTLASAVDAAVEQAVTGDGVQVMAQANPGVELLAVRPSWVQVTAKDGTVLFEKILDAGERYSVPPLQEAAVLRAGNSGSVYFQVNGQTYGPAAKGANVVKNVNLGADALLAAYKPADPAVDSALAQFVADAGAVVAPVPATE